MDLYYMDMSGPSRSVMLTAKALGIKVNKKYVDILKEEQMKPEFVAINPQHCLPTIVDEGLVLWESRAICTYLASKYGKDDSLYPKDPRKRALINRLLYFDLGTLYKRAIEYVTPPIYLSVKPDPAKLESIKEALGLLENFLKGHDFCVGNSLTIADFVLITTVSSIIEAGIDVSSFSNITAWVQRCQSQMPGYETENDVGAKQFGDFLKAKLAECK